MEDEYVRKPPKVELLQNRNTTEDVIQMVLRKAGKIDEANLLRGGFESRVLGYYYPLNLEQIQLMVEL